MATKSKIAETSFRIGCGRYIQEHGAIALLGEEILRLGKKKPFLFGGKTALSLTENTICDSLKKSGLKGVFKQYDGFCCREVCDEIMKSKEFKKCDIVVGIGGGNVVDAAKYCAVKSGLPVINIPTSSATCASVAPLSVCYNQSFQTVGTTHHKVEVNAVLADMDILGKQPARLLLSGIYDAMAKLYEINQRMLGVSPDEVDIGLLSSYEMSKFLCERLTAKKAECVADLEAGRDSKALYDMIFLTVALTGVVSGLARGSNQCAIAHKIYEGLRTLFPQEVRTFLHGELVAIGLIVQIAYNEDPTVTPQAFAAEMKKFKMPVTLVELGVPEGEETYQALFEHLVASSAMKGTTEEEQTKLKRVLHLI